MTHYHLRRQDRRVDNPQELAQILHEGKYAVIALARDQEPYVVALSYGYDEPGQALYFHCAPEGLKIEFLRANPNVCAVIILDHGYVKEQCEHHYASVILRGKLEEVKDLPEKKHGLAILMRHLEDNPEPIMNRNIKDDQSYDRVMILRLRIAEMTGKKGK